jgi:hypothetical protein
MKTTTSKKLNTRVNTICDFNSVAFPGQLNVTDTTTLGTDPTNTTVTIVTTVNTHLGAQKLVAY